MKLKNWVLWLLFAALVASEFFLFSANLQKSDALALVLETKRQLADLQAQVDELKGSNAVVRDSEFSKMRAENQDLPRLRNQVTQLQDANAQLKASNDRLTTQLKQVVAIAQDQQKQLEKYAAEKQQARVAAQSATVQSDAATLQNACINYLRQIDAAKQMWALENNKTANDVPTTQDLSPYFKDNVFPVCPAGGTYTIGAVGVDPVCSIPGHVLPQ